MGRPRSPCPVFTGERQHGTQPWSAFRQQNLLKFKSLFPFNADILNKLGDSVKNVERKLISHWL